MSASLEVTSDAAARTVTVTVPTDQWVNMITLIPDYMSIVAPELTEMYGGEAAWENVCGTGPFILSEFVDNSTCTFVRNPDYWETNPVGPGMGDQLPYVEIRVADNCRPVHQGSRLPQRPD
jgi:ABC-type transport system substrate-binding protein